MVTVINPPSRSSTTTTTTRDAVGEELKHQASSPIGGGNSKGGGGDDGDEYLRGNDGGDEWNYARPDATRARFRVGMMVLLVTVLMTFASLTIAFVLLSTRPNWQSFELPKLLWLSTGLIISSSLAIELARRAWRSGAKASARVWLRVTGVLGIAFVASQFVCWQQLASSGAYQSSNPHSSFFYLLTGIHALHLIGGIVALAYLLWRIVPDERTSSVRQQAAIDAGALYWHFIDGLWVYLLVLLVLWR